MKVEEYDTHFILEYKGQYCKRVLTTSGTDSEIIKSSPNIIDILEVGDYVNGGQVREIEKDYIRISGGSYIWQFLKKEEIKSIATKEQFKNIEYEVK